MREIEELDEQIQPPGAAATTDAGGASSVELTQILAAIEEHARARAPTRESSRKVGMLLTVVLCLALVVVAALAISMLVDVLLADARDVMQTDG